MVGYCGTLDRDVVLRSLLLPGLQMLDPHWIRMSACEDAEFQHLTCSLRQAISNAFATYL